MNAKIQRLSLSMALMLGVIACQRPAEKTCNPPCRYNAPCIDGVCQCPLPFEGASCESDVRDRFAGTWEGRRRCDGIRSGLRYTIWRDDSLLFFMNIAGSFYGSTEETLQIRLLDPYQIQMPPQILRDTPLYVSGYGEQRSDSLFLRLQVQSSANRIDTCYWDLKKR